MKIVIPTASSSPSPVHTRDSAGRAQQCWHRRRRFMTCGFFPPSMHVYRPLAFKNTPSIFLWRYFLGVCPLLETTLLPQGHFIQSLEGGGLLCLLYNLAALFMAAAATQAFIIPPLLLPSSAGWDVFDLTGVALFGRALFPSPLFPLYGGWKAIKPTPTMPHHSSASLLFLFLSISNAVAVAL